MEVTVSVLMMVGLQIRALLGGRLVFIASGAAPLRKDVHEMLKVVFSCEVVQGVSFFGQTSWPAYANDALNSLE